MAKSYKARIPIELFEAGERFQCETCFHNKTHNCSINQPGMACIYWWDLNSKVVGFAYKEFQTHCIAVEERG